MTTRGFAAIALAVLVAFATGVASTEEPLSRGNARFIVELACGMPLPLSPRSSAVLAERTFTTLKSAEYNSLSPEWHFPASELHEEYQQAMAGQHLRVIFDGIQTMDSRGGLLRVREIIVRLGLESQHAPFPDHFVDSIFTIDDKGEIVGYALYSGPRVLELWRTVVQETGSENPCRLPTRLPGAPERAAR